MWGPEILALMIPIIALMIPIVALLTHHQRRMAEVVNRPTASPELLEELRRLREEVSHLRERVNQQAIAMDDLGDRMLSGPRTPAAPPAVPDDVRSRLGG